MKPGSWRWLLRHELRLSWAASATLRADGRRALERKSIAVWVVMIVGLHVAAWLVLDGLPAADVPVAPSALAAMIPLLAVGLLFMMASAMKASSEALFERADFDLLFSSPVSTRSVMAVRMAVIVGRVAAIYLFFLAPLAHVGLALGRPRLLVIYPVTLALAALAACAAMLLTLALVRLCGVRGARMVAQVLGPLFGASLFIGAQLTHTGLREPALQLYAALAPWMNAASPFGLLARAALGETAAVLKLAGLALAALGASTLLHEGFARRVQQAAGTARRVRTPVRKRRWRFGRSQFSGIVAKEWISIARDPQLISQVLLQTLYLLPLAAALFAKTGPSLATTATAMVFLCASLSSALAWIVVAAEDAPDLLASSPVDPALVARAKLAAVLLPVLALAAPALLWAGLRQPLQGFIMLVTLGAAMTSAALIATWFARPAARGEFRQRARGNSLASVFDLLSTCAWAACAYLLLHGSGQPAWTWPLSIGAAGSAACALVFLGLARLWRQTRLPATGV